MATFAALSKGTLARKRGVVCTNLSGEEFVCDLRVLNGTDDKAILKAAAEETLEQKREPRKGDPVYDFAVDVQTLLRAAVDSDSPDSDPRPFFQSAAQILDGLDRDRIHYLVAIQTAHQDEHSPLQHDLNDEQFKDRVHRIVASVEGDGGPFEDLGPRLLRRFTRALAVQCLILPMYRSASSSESSVTT